MSPTSVTGKTTLTAVELLKEESDGKREKREGPTTQVNPSSISGEKVGTDEEQRGGKGGPVPRRRKKRNWRRGREKKGEGLQAALAKTAAQETTHLISINREKERRRPPGMLDKGVNVFCGGKHLVFREKKEKGPTAVRERLMTRY